MSLKSDWQKKQAAVQAGIKRPEPIQAKPDQPLTYVLSDRKFFAHASLSSAKAEKEFLQAALDRPIKIYKVWNTQSIQINKDMTLIRRETEKLQASTSFYKALVRVLSGAGY